ncbi:MAG: Macrolide export protein MacA [Syntrophaceae bacterium PtaU1.Bin231]|nr:MAG: Macrolide export protein MacA [Syntrophaceae bacterium PtaU1.Bin231]HOG17294.1 efflux RND transporter periplasmic adaptor subunit [Syntrophales bacterium]
MKKIFWIAAVAIVVLGAVGLFAYKKMTAKPAIKVLETGKVERGAIRGVLVETGIIKSQVGAVVKIGARATGKVVKMGVKVGDRVKNGQIIALIDDREIVQAVQQQKAALAAAESTLRQVRLTYPERIREAKANFEYAGQNYEREQQLLKNEYTTKDSFEKARSSYEATGAILKRLEDEYQTQIKITEANIAEIRAQIAQQETKLSYTKIYSPLEGVVSEVTAQEGETIVAGLQVANLVTVLDPLRLEMWIYVDETDIGRVRLGQPVEYTVDTYPNRTFRGNIEKIYPQPVVKENIVYYLSIVKVSKEDAAFLKPEMTTHARIITTQKEDAVTAPNAAVKFDKGKQVVYQVDGAGKVKKTVVKIGIRGEDRTEILSGVEAGALLATKLILPVSPEAEAQNRR